MSIAQAERPARITTPLGPDALGLYRLAGTERLSAPFEYRVSCVSEDAELDLERLIGQDVGIEIDGHEGGTREINAIVASAAQIGSLGEYAGYELVLKPWFWLLSHASDARIFTDLAVPDIVKTVLRDAGFTDFDDRLTASYPAWNFCVQYGESTADFLSRLMEHEGIYYRFVHEGGKHVMVLCDSSSAHDAAPGYDTVPHYPVGGERRRERDHLSEWRTERHVSSGGYAMRDFRFDTPGSDLLVRASNPLGGSHDGFERYEYPAAIPNESSGALQRSYGERLARQRLEGEQAAHAVSSGAGDASGLAAGRLFTLEGCARRDQNREYLIVEAGLTVDLDGYFSGTGDGGAVFECRVECIDSRRPYRPPLVTGKPRITGPQTAIVCGPSGEEIWTDVHGRVKLQFHWDRHGKRDEHSSCWVRVSQLWAGEGWGGIHLPRVGQEVIVEFVDGDPDRPLVTGRVYNGDRPVPYALPANATQSGIKSRSSKGGAKANFNEIRMEDRKGAEELVFHAERDLLTDVERHRNETVGEDQTESIGNDRTEEVGNDHVERIGNDRGVTVGGNSSLWVTNTALVDGRKVEIVANDEISLRTGAAQIVMKKNGDITIKGKSIKVVGSAGVVVKGSTVKIN